MIKITSSGGQALLRLGILATLIAITTTSISLFFYHASGDIYLDRSRPGFLPDHHESEKTSPSSSLHFSEEGTITSKELEEYLTDIKNDITIINEIKKPFSKDSLSDQSLGISEDIIQNKSKDK